MHRAIAICLLLLLPFQFSWAAVAAYCAHESTAQPHLGHHVHDGVADSGATGSGATGSEATDSDAADSGAAAATVVVDIDGCHSLGCCLGITSGSLPLAACDAGTRHHAPLVAAVSALPPPPPDRPQWAGLA